MTQGPVAGLSFSGADVKAYATVPYRFFKHTKHRDRGEVKLPGFVRLKDLQTFSVSIYRDVSPVRALGHRNVRGYTRGGRTIAGSLIFALIDEHPLQKLLDTWVYEYSYDIGYWDGHNFPDQIPPFDLHLVYSAELPSLVGENRLRKPVPPAIGTLTVFGLNLTNDGMVTSIEDLLTENTYQYQARDMHIFQGWANSRDPKLPFVTQQQGGSNRVPDFRSARQIGALLAMDPSLSPAEAAALTNAQSVSDGPARSEIDIVNPGFMSQEEINSAIYDAYTPSLAPKFSDYDFPE